MLETRILIVLLFGGNTATHEGSTATHGTATAVSVALWMQCAAHTGPLGAEQTP